MSLLDGDSEVIERSKNRPAGFRRLRPSKGFPNLSAALVAVLLLLASCGGDEQAELDATEALFGSSEEIERGAERAVRLQGHMRVCMGEAGFEYVPFVADPDLNAPRRARAAVLAGSDETFADEFGYGVTAGMVTAIQSSVEDPNLQRRRALSEADAAAWDREFAECNAAGWTELGVDLRELGEVVQDQGAALHALDDRILADERVVAAAPAWVTCMREHGYQYSTVADAVADIRDRVQRVADQFDPSDASGGTLPEFDEAMAEMQVVEVRTAGDDIECRRRSGLDQVLAEVRADVESEFIVEYEDLFERRRQVVESGS